jgi:hypothetical protein
VHTGRDGIFDFLLICQVLFLKTLSVYDTSEVAEICNWFCNKRSFTIHADEEETYCMAWNELQAAALVKLTSYKKVNVCGVTR